MRYILFIVLLSYSCSVNQKSAFQSPDILPPIKVKQSPFDSKDTKTIAEDNDQHSLLTKKIITKLYRHFIEGEELYRK